MLQTTLAYNLLSNLFWSITPALPRGAAGTRQPVGSPETIPDFTFITRPLVAADGFTAAERTHLNLYVNQAIQYHTLFGLGPIQIGSIEEILTRLNGAAAPMGRIRIVSHGDAAFMFVPLFTNGSWEFGIQEDRLDAFQDSDEEGLRFLISGDKHKSPTLPDSVSAIIDGLRASTTMVGVLAPFGLTAAGSTPTAGNMQQLFDVINDKYQVQNGIIQSVTVHTATPPATPPPDTFALITTQQQTILTASLTLIENAVRDRLRGTVVGTTALTDAHFDALRTTILGATPRQLGIYGAAVDLPAGAMASLATAMAASPRVENDLRNAIRGTIADPLFRNVTANILNGLTLFNKTALTLGGTVRDGTFIGADPDLLSFFFVCNDLFFLQHGQVRIAGTPVTTGQQTSLRDGLRAIGTIIAARVVASGSGITNAELTRLRSGVEALTDRQSLTADSSTIDSREFPDLQAANVSIPGGFRARLNHLRSIMRPTSNVDVRGCLVGKSLSFLDALRNFLGDGASVPVANLPVVSAPDWFQSFPSRVRFGGFGTSVFIDIDALVTAGASSAITGADVTSSLTDWRALIDFDPHFTFVSGLFAGSMFDFASLQWCVFQAGGAGPGIPVLRMEAERIDDIVNPALGLGGVIQRFATIFEIASGSVPAAAVLTRLTQLQPLLVTFKTARDAVAAIVNPADPALAGLNTQLTTLAGQITAVGFPAPGAPLVPASASLADIQASVGNIQAYVDGVLTTNLGAFFTAVQGRLGHANAQIRYYYNIGLPLLLQSSATPTAYTVSTHMSANTNAERTSRVAAALRSWMRIQWEGTAAQAAAMNVRIAAVPIGNATQFGDASQSSMLSEDDPATTPTADAGINPTPKFHTHIVTRP